MRDKLQVTSDKLLHPVFGVWRVTCHLSLVTALCLSGCVTRSLTIRTDPPGALVYINDQLKGASPVTYDFMWYGWHRVMLRKDGFERVEDRKLLSAPFYLWIPFDLAMELLPIRLRDAHTWNYALTKTQQPPAPVPPKIASPQVAPKVDAESSIAEPAKEGSPEESAPPPAEPSECPGCGESKDSDVKEPADEAN